MIIYCAENKINGKKYVGKTSKSLDERIYHHFWRANYGSQTYFHNALRKYGKKNFVWKKIAGCSECNCNSLEKMYIKKLGDYNLTLGGDGGDTLSQHPKKAKIFEKSSKKCKKTWESKFENINQLNKFRKNISQISKKAWENGKIGNQTWKEKKSKSMKKAWQISEKLKNLNHINNVKKWKLITPKGKLITIENLSHFCRQNNLTQPLMIAVANGERNHHKGWKCERYGGSFAGSEMDI